jgi:hypothetical protein
MTDTAQSLASEYSWSAPAGAAAYAPPIPPPATVGPAQGPAGPSIPAACAGSAPDRGATPAAARSAPRSSAPRSSARRPRWALAAVAIAAVVAIALLLAGVFKSGSSFTKIQAPQSAAAAAQAQAGLRQPGVLSVSGQAPFVLHYPPGWTRLSTRQLAKIANVPAAGLIAEGGRALLLVRPKAPLTQSLSTLSSQLTKSLSASFTDFKLLSTGTIRTLAGPAWVYTFERTKHGLVQSEVVVSTSKVAYELDIALRGGADRAASEIGEIVRSFQA